MTPQEPLVSRIVLAEDNPADIYLIELALREHDVRYEVEVAEGGKQALSLLRRYDQPGETPLPALIVLDLNLPQHDGIEVLRCVRKTESLAHIPVVVLTSSDSPRDEAQSLESGANRYLRKPSSLQEFIAIGGVLKELLAVHHHVARL